MSMDTSTAELSFDINAIGSLTKDNFLSELRSLLAETLSNFLVELLRITFSFIREVAGKCWRSSPWYCMVCAVIATSVSLALLALVFLSLSSHSAQLHLARPHAGSMHRTRLKGRKVLVQSGYLIRFGGRVRGHRH